VSGARVNGETPYRSGWDHTSIPFVGNPDKLSQVFWNVIDIDCLWSGNIQPSPSAETLPSRSSFWKPRNHRKSAILQKDKYISGYGKKLFSELVTLPRWTPPLQITRRAKYFWVAGRTSHVGCSLIKSSKICITSVCPRIGTGWKNYIFLIAFRTV